MARKTKRKKRAAKRTKTKKTARKKATARARKTKKAKKKSAKAAPRRKKTAKRRVDRELDEALMETFPGSDPVALTDPTRSIKE
jgi:hypothetical protein